MKNINLIFEFKKAVKWMIQSGHDYVQKQSDTRMDDGHTDKMKQVHPLQLCWSVNAIMKV